MIPAQMPPIRMTLAELCRAVAEEMGIEDAWWCEKCQAYVDGRQVTYEENHETCGYPVIDRDSKLATGNGMLVVLDWLAYRDEEPEFNAFPDVLQDMYETSKRWHWSYFIEPTPVLLAFMKAVKGVDVELVE